jgi:hypothetical protein
MTQSCHADPGQGDGAGVGVIGLATLTSGVDPHPRRQLRGHVDDGLAGAGQPQHQMLADALAALGRLHPVRPPAGLGEHRLEARRVCPKTAAAEHLLIGGHRLDRGGPLVRVYPDHHATGLAQ